MQISQGTIKRLSLDLIDVINVKYCVKRNLVPRVSLSPWERGCVKWSVLNASIIKGLRKQNSPSFTFSLWGSA